jgi:hypothetical protein
MQYNLDKYEHRTAHWPQSCLEGLLQAGTPVVL